MLKVSATHTHFVGYQFEYTSINNAIFDYTTIKFLRAQLFRISIRHCVSVKVNVTYADLRGRNWQNVWCEKCIFHNADFTDTNISNAIFINSDFRNCTTNDDNLNSLKGSILSNGTVINYK